MRALLLLSFGAAATGCTGLSPGALALADAPHHATHVHIAAPRSAPSRVPIHGPVELRRQHPATDVFEREQSLGLTTVTVVQHADLEVRSVVTVQQMPDGSLRETEDVLDIETSAERARHLAEQTIGARLTAQVDDRNRIVEPTATSTGHSRQMIFILKLLLDRIRPTFPDAAVEVGHRWSAEPFTVDSRPVRGWVAVDAEPQFELLEVERRDGVPTAVIGWFVALRVAPFGQLGTPIEGRGAIRGTTTLELADGKSGVTDLEIEIGLRPAGAPEDVEPLVRVGARYRETLRRRVSATSR